MKAPFLPLFALPLLAFAVGCTSSNPTVPRRAGVAANPLEPTPVEEIAGEDATREDNAETAPEAPPAPVEPAPPRHPVVARLGTETVEVDELLGAMMHVDSQGLLELLGWVVMNRLVESEAERLSIEVEETAVNERFLVSMSEMEKNLQLRHPDISLDQWIAAGLGLDPTRYRARQRREVESQLLMARVIRVFIFSHDWIEARVIVTETAEEAGAALEKVREGAPFARIAAEVSIDPTGARGGRIPPILRNDTSVSRLAFDTKKGECGGPVEEGGRWYILQVEEINAPLHGNWGDISETIEASLQERPLEEPEIWLWRAEMQQQHSIDLNPFFELVGEPPPNRQSQFQ
jgi:hypothetical protein